MAKTHTTQTITVKQLARQALQSLQAGADGRVAAQSRVYFKSHEEVHFFGVSVPALRQLERALYQQVKGSWTVTEATACCELLLKDKRHEARMFGILLLARFHKTYERALLGKCENWLTRNYCDNWALVDTLAPSVLAPLLRRFPDLLPQVAVWTQAENLWVRRASVVALIPLARKSEHLDAAYANAERLFGYPEDLIHKAIGWLLREAGRADLPRLRAFLLQHGPRLPRTALRYAIERFPEAERKQLLAQTR
ncbi:MAG: DNA alkylation repair protein [Acidobacteria bacterium]|nr:DNA alkylation repair protein [Acidobacteriota bacterium]MBI3421867.1 DNA alkylation repair protein [Acidobacteriota bacterium]